MKLKKHAQFFSQPCLISCRLYIDNSGCLTPRALVAQRIEQTTSKFLTPPLHRTVYRVVGERGVVVRLACDELPIFIEMRNSVASPS